MADGGGNLTIVRLTVVRSPGNGVTIKVPGDATGGSEVHMATRLTVFLFVFMAVPAFAQEPQINAFASDVLADQQMELYRMIGLLREMQK